MKTTTVFDVTGFPRKVAARKRHLFKASSAKLLKPAIPRSKLTSLTSPILPTVIWSTTEPVNSGIPFIKIADRVEVTVDLKGKRVSGPPLTFKQ